MPRYRGHIYNWHDTRDLRVLDPAYVSTVDSGNLAGHLIAIAQACREWKAPPLQKATVRQSLSDTICLAQEALGAGPGKADLGRDWMPLPWRPRTPSLLWLT